MVIKDVTAMVAAEVLRLVRRRGLMAWTAVLTVGLVCCYYGLFAVQHAADPRRHPPAGGIRTILRSARTKAMQRHAADVTKPG